MKIYCPECNQNTKHSELKSGSIKDYDEDDPSIWGEYRWFVYKCDGCDHITFCKENYYSEDYEHNEDGEVIIKPYEVKFYPEKPIIDKELLVQQTYLNIPNAINNLYREVINAYNSSSYTLVAIGLRTLLEAILNEKGSHGDNVFKKIENADFIPINIRTNLHALRFIGNEATHNLNTPDKYDLLEGIEIIQDILNISYSLDYRSTLFFTKIMNKKKKI